MTELSQLELGLDGENIEEEKRVQVIYYNSYRFPYWKKLKTAIGSRTEST